VSSSSAWHPVLVCPNPDCNSRNRIPPHLSGQAPVCGRCKRELPDPYEPAVLMICPKCRLVNRVFAHPVDLTPLCGNCHLPLEPLRESAGSAEAGHLSDWVENGMSFEKLPFEILPPGEWSIEELLRFYESKSNEIRASGVTGEMQPERLSALVSLKPSTCYRGIDMWTGYHVFSFAWTDRVVLECPLSGNATYVLWGDWKGMAQHTKQELRRVFKSNYVKIIHQGDWLQRVRSALGDAVSAKPRSPSRKKHRRMRRRS